MIYLDYSANTPVSEDVLRCFCETEREFFGNPNSTHDAGKPPRSGWMRLRYRLPD